MRLESKTLPAVWVLVLGLLIAGPAAADDALLGEWQLTHIGEVEPADGHAVTYAFGADSLLVTITASGATETWEVGYTVSDEGELTLESLPGTGAGVGEPSPLVLTYSIDGDALIIKRSAEGFGLTFTRNVAE